MVFERYDEEEGLSGQTVVTPLTENELDPDISERDNLLPLGIANESLSGRTLPIPVWLAETSKSFRWGWVPLPLRKAGRTTVRWLKGPQPPRELLFKPLFPSIQEAPARLIDGFFPKRRHKISLLLAVYFSWFLTWSLVLHHSVSAGHIEGFGRPDPISCSASYW